MKPKTIDGKKAFNKFNIKLVIIWHHWERRDLMLSLLFSDNDMQHMQLHILIKINTKPR